MPDSVLRASPILPHFFTTTLRCFSCFIKKLRPENIHWCAHSHVSEQKSISDGAEFEHKPITTVCYFFLPMLLYTITPLYLPSTVKVPRHFSHLLLIPTTASRTVDTNIAIYIASGVKNRGSWSDGPRLESLLCLLLVLWTWASYLSFLSLHFPDFKMGDDNSAIPNVMRIKLEMLCIALSTVSCV